MDQPRATPTVSIILPTYNRAHLLPRALHSLLVQSYQDFEVIIIDDASTDKSSDVVAPFLSDRVRYVRLETNRGPGAARNAGIKLAIGEFLAFQDSDDEWLPEKLEVQMAVFRGGDASLCVVYCDLERVLPDGTRTPFVSPPEVTSRLIDPKTGFYQVHGLGIQSTVIRRSCLGTAAPFDEQLPTLEDLDLFLRLSQQHGFYHVEKTLVRYHATPGLTSSARNRYASRAELLRRHWPLLLRAHPLFVLRELVNVARGNWLARRSEPE